MKIANIRKYLDLYDQEKYLFEKLGPAIRRRGYMKFDEFYKIGMWKSARQKPKYLKNKKIIEKVSRDAFGENDEKEKMRKLCAILTMVYPQKYGIIDIRCIEMLIEKGFEIGKNINMGSWEKFISIIRELAEKNGLTPREMDKVLFAMHKEMLEGKNYQNLY